MLILTKAIFCLMLGFILSTVFGSIIVPFLHNRNIDQRLSIYLEDRHKSKSHVPTMGGLIFILPTLFIFFILFLIDKIDLKLNTLIIIFTFISYGIIGFIDDFLIVKRNNNNGLKEGTKFFLQIICSIIFFYLFLKCGNEPLIWIHSLHIKYSIGWLYGIFILLVLTSSSNAVNITDGLDGLAGGLSFIVFITFGIITFNTTWLDGYDSIALFCFILAGSILGFLVYNVNPAKIFMGDTGSLALGATMGSVAILTRHELLLVLIGIIFVIETMTCIIQRVYYKFTKKRLFLMTPIHHSFEKRGYNERDIVKYFWIVGLIASMIGIMFGVIL